MTKIKINGIWKDIANMSTNDVIRNPDWSRAVALTSAQLQAGWIVPEDGIIVGDFLPTLTSNGAVRLTINNILVAFAFNNSQGGGQDIRNGLAGTQVAAGDVLNVSQAIIVDNNYTIRFVPYKVSKVDNTVPSLAGTYNNVMHFFTFKQGVGVRATTGAIPLLQYNRYNVTINSAEMYLSDVTGWTNVKPYLSIVNNGGFYDLIFDWQDAGLIPSDLAGEWGATRISYTVTDK